MSFPNFSKSVNETSTEARLAPGSCTVEFKQQCMCVHRVYSVVQLGPNPISWVLQLPQLLFENRTSYHPIHLVHPACKSTFWFHPQFAFHQRDILWFRNLPKGQSCWFWMVRSIVSKYCLLCRAGKLYWRFDRFSFCSTWSLVGCKLDMIMCAAHYNES